MSTDSVCGMTVDEKEAIKIKKDNQTYYFCSSHYKEKFLAAPAGAQSKGKSTGCCG